ACRSTTWSRSTRRTCYTPWRKRSPCGARNGRASAPWLPDGSGEHAHEQAHPEEDDDHAEHDPDERSGAAARLHRVPVRRELPGAAKVGDDAAGRVEPRLVGDDAEGARVGQAG